MPDIDLDRLAAISDDPLFQERRDHQARRRRAGELVAHALSLVAAGRITIVEAARLTGTSRQRIHQALRSRRPRIEVEESRIAYVDRLWARSLATHDREEARWQVEQDKADAQWEADMAALDDEEEVT
jgi:hypothetical protein